VRHLPHTLLNGKDALLCGNEILQLREILPVGILSLLVLVWGPRGSGTMYPRSGNTCLQPLRRRLPNLHANSAPRC